jgi:ABC-type multidrug transport system permease subunit
VRPWLQRLLGYVQVTKGLKESILRLFRAVTRSQHFTIRFAPASKFEKPARLGILLYGYPWALSWMILTCSCCVVSLFSNRVAGYIALLGLVRIDAYLGIDFGLSLAGMVVQREDGGPYFNWDLFSMHTALFLSGFWPGW